VTEQSVAPDVENAPTCSCNYSGEGTGLHRPDCVRFVWLVENYRPPGLRVVDGVVERSLRGRA
jgi:hypothetical protein